MAYELVRFARAVRVWQRQWLRNRIVIPVSDSTKGPPTVYFLAPDFNEPSGGIRTIYRHADILNLAGIPAAVLHQKRGFRCTWFENATRVTSVTESEVGPADLLVVGELDVDLLAAHPVQPRHLILNQSGFLTWSRAGDLVTAYYATQPGPLAIVTVSEYAQDLLNLAFPDIDVRRVRLGLDIDRFSPPEHPAGPRISYFARRSTADVDVALRVLSRRAVLDGWMVRPLKGLTHAQVADELQASSVFLCASYHEGFGLPPAEAMACGSYVVGFHGYGGREYFDPRFSSPVETGDVIGLVQALEAALQAEKDSPGWLRERGLDAAASIRSRYSPQHESMDVLQAYGDLLNF